MIRRFRCPYCNEELDRLVKRYLVKKIDYEVYSVNINGVLRDYYMPGNDAFDAVDDNITYSETDSEDDDSEFEEYMCAHCKREIDLEECLIEEEDDDDDNYEDDDNDNDTSSTHRANTSTEEDIWDLSKTL